MRMLNLALMAALVTGCAAATTEPPPVPTLYEYSQEFLDRAADELDALPASSAVAVLVGDYGAVRAEIRAMLFDE